jgi:hypothetical protein
MLMCLVIPSDDEAYDYPSRLVGTGASAENLADHLRALALDMRSHAQSRIARSDGTTTPGDLVALG